MEIGFGQGDFLIRQAKQNSSQNFIGIEIEKKLITRLSKRLIAEKLENVLLLHADARVAIERFFKQRSIHRLYALFPFPWPKKRHWHHRLFQKNFLKKINSRMRHNGQVLIMTDYGPYSEWIVAQARNTGFCISSEETSSRFETQFELKWKGEGQKNFYQIRLRKKNHIDIPIPQSIPLLTVNVKSFKPNAFFPKTITGSQHIIFKKFIFDDSRKTAMQHVFVIEGPLIQKFLVRIQKIKNGWDIRPDPKAKIIKTRGIQKSLEEVKNACLRSTTQSL